MNYIYFLFCTCVLFAAHLQAQHDDSTGLKTSTKAESFASSVPRLYGPDKIPDVSFSEASNSEEGGGVDPADMQEEFTGYFIGIVALSAIGFFFAFVTAVSCICFCICRNCCNQCGGRNPKSEGYDSKQRLIPFLIVVLATVLVIIFCGVGYGGNTEFSDGFSGKTGVLSVAQILFSDTVTFFDRNLQAPLDVVIDFIENSKDEVEASLDRISGLEDGTDTLEAKLLTLENRYQNYSVETAHEDPDNPGQNLTFPCGFCNTVSDEMRTVREDIARESDSSFSTISELQADADRILDELAVNVRDEINTIADDLREQMSGIQEAETDVNTQIETIKGYDGQRETAFAVLFVIPLTFVFFVLIGGIIKSGLCFIIMCFIGVLTMVIFWILFAFHLPMATILADGCLWLDRQEQDFKGSLGDFGGDVALACLRGTSLSELFNLTELLPNINDEIDFDALDNLNTNFNFTELRQFQSEVDGLANEEFELRLDECLDDLNTITVREENEYWTRDNITQFYYPVSPLNPVTGMPPSIRYCDQPPSDLPDTCLEVNYTAYICQETFEAERQSQSDFQEALDEFRIDTDDVIDTAEELSENITDAKEAFMGIQTRLEEELIDDINTLVKSISCNFVGQAYRDFKTQVCFVMMGGMADMVLSLFFVALFTIFVCIFAIILAKRIDSPGGDRHLPRDDSLYETGDYSQPETYKPQPHNDAPVGGEPVPMTQIDGVEPQRPMDIAGVPNIQPSQTRFVEEEPHMRQDSVDPNEPVGQMIRPTADSADQPPGYTQEVNQPPGYDEGDSSAESAAASELSISRDSDESDTQPTPKPM